MHEFRIESLTPWIELLCEAGDARARDRLLLEGVLALDLADAAAIWRRTDDGTWREHVARGPADSLPRSCDVAAIAQRTIANDTLGTRKVHVSNGVALALGGTSQERDPHEVAEALLTTYSLVTTDSPAHTWPAPLPVRPSTRKQPARPAGSEEARRVHHDLRNALTSLRATEDMLSRFADGLSADESERFRTAVERECSRAGALLAQGLCAQGIAAPGSMEPGPNPAPPSRSKTLCRPAEILEQVLDAERAASSAAGIETRVLIDPAVRSATSTIPPQHLARIVQNLLVNARQALLRDQHPSHLPSPHTNHTSHCIWVTLELTRNTRPTLVLLVEDDGPGIEPHNLERVFESGFTTRPDEGAGSGLSIVRALAQQAGGSAHAEIRVLGGARLRVLLPLRTDDEASPFSDP